MKNDAELIAELRLFNHSDSADRMEGLLEELERLRSTAPSIGITVEKLAKMLAWADRANDVRTPARFIEGAERYWNNHAADGWKGSWIKLASTLLGVEYLTFRERAELKAALTEEVGEGDALGVRLR